MNHYETLGIQKSATPDEIKKAYRKLASEHHPDKGGDTQKFQEIQSAYEVLSDPQKRQMYDNPQQNQRSVHASDLDEIMQMMRRAHQMHSTPEIMTNIPIDQMFKGAEMRIGLNGVDDLLKIPVGLPDGARLSLKTEGGKDIIVTVRIVAPGFKLTNANEAQYQQVNSNGVLSGLLECGDVETIIEVDALDIILGAWVDVKDVLGVSYSVRVPSGLNLGQRLKVKGKGYYHWDVQKNKAAPARADMYVIVRPVFKPIKELNFEKIQALYDQTKPPTVDVKV